MKRWASVMWLGIVAFVIVLFLPLLSSNNSGRLRPEASDARTICAALATSVSHHGEFPSADSWQVDLVDGGYLTAGDLVSRRGFLGPPSQVTHDHYFYFELPPERDFDATALLLYENPGHYRSGDLSGGTFAVFADCHLWWLSDDELQVYLDRQRDLPHTGP